MSDLISSDMAQCDKDSWGTDPRVFKAMDNEFNFSLDAAANGDNHKCQLWYNEKTNALTVDWSADLERLCCDKTVWINPPYSRGMIKKFMDKCIEQREKGVTSVMLVPSTLDAQWLPLDEIDEIRIVTGGRLSFMHPLTGKKIAGNTKGSMFVLFTPELIRDCEVSLIDREVLLARGEV